MNKMRIGLTLAIFIIIAACTTIKRSQYERFSMKEQARIGDCIKPWSYVNIGHQSYIITVLYFTSSRIYGETDRPNFLIGLTENGDTIGILDKYYPVRLEKNNKVRIVGGDWEKPDIIFDYARYQYSKNPEDNDLLCKIDIVMRGRILYKIND